MALYSKEGRTRVEETSKKAHLKLPQMSGFGFFRRGSKLNIPTQMYPNVIKRSQKYSKEEYSFQLCINLNTCDNYGKTE